MSIHLQHICEVKIGRGWWKCVIVHIVLARKFSRWWWNSIVNWKEFCSYCLPPNDWITDLNTNLIKVLSKNEILAWEELMDAWFRHPHFILQSSSTAAAHRHKPSHFLSLISIRVRLISSLSSSSSLRRNERKWIAPIMRSASYAALTHSLTVYMMINLPFFSEKSTTMRSENCEVIVCSWSWKIECEWMIVWNGAGGW